MERYQTNVTYALKFSKLQKPICPLTEVFLRFFFDIKKMAHATINHSY